MFVFHKLKYYLVPPPRFIERTALCSVSCQQKNCCLSDVLFPFACSKDNAQTDKSSRSRWVLSSSETVRWAWVSLTLEELKEVGGRAAWMLTLQGVVMALFLIWATFRETAPAPSLLQLYHKNHKAGASCCPTGLRRNNKPCAMF
jgi:hypothetical protein